jgi:hypothetical protein
VILKRENLLKPKLEKKLKKFMRVRPWKALNALEKEACYSDTSTPLSNYSGFYSDLEEE